MKGIGNSWNEPEMRVDRNVGSQPWYPLESSGELKKKKYKTPKNCVWALAFSKLIPAGRIQAPALCEDLLVILV